MKYQLSIIILFIVYIVLVTALMVWQGIGIAPDRYFFVLLFVSLLVKRTRSFLLDWIPFILLLLSYEFLRGVAGTLAFNVHYQELIRADKLLFGEVPTLVLQKWLFGPNLSWYDFLGTILYFLHFAIPLAFGFILWLGNKNHFRQFVIGLTLLHYAAWATFMLYPASPPWLASQKGYLPHVNKIMDQTLAAFPTRLELPTIYHQFNPNPVAAIPSLHAAQPLLVLLLALKFLKKKGLIILPYALGVWFFIVYLGEHYVVDILIGALYAVVFYFLSNILFKHIKWLSS